MSRSKSTVTVGTSVNHLASEAITALAEARGTNTAALVRQLIERELASNTAEVDRALSAYRTRVARARGIDEPALSRLVRELGPRRRR